MSHLSQAFQALAESRPGLTQVELCNITGISQPQMSRYFKGTSQPSADALEKICEKLPDPDRAAIAAAYLRDMLPESAQDLVRIISELPAGVSPEFPDVPMPRELREAIAYLAKAAARHTAVADSILATVRILRGERSRTGYGDEPRILREQITPLEAAQRETGREGGGQS